MWFKVDDRFHSHPKTTATSLAALGLWAVAGAWSGDHLTDGFVPDQVVSVLSRGTNELADELVATGLWRRTKGGYRFHQWHIDGDGTRRNPTKKDVEEERRKKAEAGRKGGRASGKARSRPEAGAEARASRLVEPPTRPDPLPSLREGGSGDARAAPLGAPRVPADDLSPPNGARPRAALPPDLTAVRQQLRQAAGGFTAVGRRKADPLAELRAATEPPPENETTE